MVAIRNHCLECCGYLPVEVERCTAPACWLYPYRFGCTPEKAEDHGKDIDPQASPLRGYGAQKP